MRPDRTMPGAAAAEPHGAAAGFGRPVERCADLLAILAGWSLMGLALLVTADVLARKLFDFAIDGSVELGGYALAITSAAGFCHALVGRAHIRIDIVHKRLPAGARAVLDLAAFACLAVFAALLAWRGVAVALQSAALRATAPTQLGTPLVLPQTVWSAILLLFFGITTFAVLRMLVLLLRGRVTQAASMYGIASVEEEVEQELEGTRSRQAEFDAAEAAQ